MEKETKRKITDKAKDMLKVMKLIGFEVVKCNSEQIALNKKDNSFPFVMLNDVGLDLGDPCKWHLISELLEVKE